tara:strand:- start:63996 stop:64535 length:540 start_codon:yes stop_codon:yes gene_type:complete
MALVCVFEPAGVFNVIVGDPVYFPFAEFGTDVLQLSGGHPPKNGSRRHYGALGHHGSGGYDTITFYHTIVHYDTSHAYKHIVMYRTAMDYGIVANGNIVPYSGGRFKIGTVYDGAILYVYLISHFDKMDVAPQNCIEPDTALISHFHIAYQGGIFGNVTILPYLRGLAIYGLNDHFFNV